MSYSSCPPPHPPPNTHTELAFLGRVAAFPRPTLFHDPHARRRAYACGRACVCVCVRERERESGRACVCVRVRAHLRRPLGDEALLERPLPKEELPPRQQRVSRAGDTHTHGSPRAAGGPYFAPPKHGAARPCPRHKILPLPPLPRALFHTHERTRACARTHTHTPAWPGRCTPPSPPAGPCPPAPLVVSESRSSCPSHGHTRITMA